MDNAALICAIAGSQSYSSALSGYGSLTMVGGGVLSLGNSSAFSGVTTVNNGAIVLSNSAALQASTVVVTPTTSSGLGFDQSVPGGNFILGGLAGSGLLGLQNNASVPAAINLTVGGNNASTTFSGVISGSGNLTKIGSGTWTLTAANLYSGTTTISGGTLQIGDGTGGHDGSLSYSGINDNTALVFNIWGLQSYANGNTQQWATCWRNQRHGQPDESRPGRLVPWRRQQQFFGYDHDRQRRARRDQRQRIGRKARSSR